MSNKLLSPVFLYYLAQMLQQHISMQFLRLGSDRSQTGTDLFFFQSAAWSYLCKGAVCKVSGELSLHHQSQSGPFISIALHVCISDSDPACVSLGPRACFTASVCILLRETQRRERGSAPYVWRRAWCCFLKVEQPHHVQSCARLQMPSVVLEGLHNRNIRARISSHFVVDYVGCSL